MEISFYATLFAIALYVIVSLLTCKRDFAMDRMLHRGIYAQAGEKGQTSTVGMRLSIRTVLGIDDEFTRGDKWITGILFGWGMMWFVILLVGSVWNWLSPWSDQTWNQFWYVVAIIMPVIWAVAGTIWFTWGGLRDMVELFRKLKTTSRNSLDNGMVVGHQNLDEKAAQMPPTTASSESRPVLR
jgi:SSS family solute:Na+ symporter